MCWKYLGKLTKSDYCIIKGKDSMLIIRRGGTFLPTPGHVRVKGREAAALLSTKIRRNLRHVSQGRLTPGILQLMVSCEGLVFLNVFGGVTHRYFTPQADRNLTGALCEL